MFAHIVYAEESCDELRARKFEIAEWLLSHEAQSETEARVIEETLREYIEVSRTIRALSYIPF